MKFKLFGRLKGGDEGKKGGGRKRGSKSGSGGSIPQDKIESMSRRGLSENDIREELRDSDYSHKQIDKALNQTVKRNAISSSSSDSQAFGGGGGGDLSGGFGGGGDLSGPAQEEGFSPFSGSTQGGGGPSDRPKGGEGLERMGGGDYDQEEETGGYDYPEEGSYSESGVSAEGVPSNARELIEIMVAEELSDIDERFDQIHDRMGKLEESVSSLKEQVSELGARREEDEKEFLKRIKDMEGYLKESQSTVGGLKKTMQEVLPALSHNIKEMNKIIEEKEQD